MKPAAMIEKLSLLKGALSQEHGPEAKEMVEALDNAVLQIKRYEDVMRRLGVLLDKFEKDGLAGT